MKLLRPEQVEQAFIESQNAVELGILSQIADKIMDIICRQKPTEGMEQKAFNLPVECLTYHAFINDVKIINLITPERMEELDKRLKSFGWYSLSYTEHGDPKCHGTAYIKIKLNCPTKMAYVPEDFETEED